MSNIGFIPIYIPKNISYKIQQWDKKSVIWIKGPFATIFFEFSPLLQCCIKNRQLFLQTPSRLKHQKWFLNPLNNNINQIWSLHVVVLKKILHAAAVGFKKYLRVRGVGYKFIINEKNIEVFAGLSHRIIEDVKKEFFLSTTRKQKMLRVRSRGLQTVTTILSGIRVQRKPNVFTGKGIRYRIETSRQREGKKRKTF